MGRSLVLAFAVAAAFFAAAQGCTFLIPFDPADDEGGAGGIRGREGGAGGGRADGSPEERDAAQQVEPAPPTACPGDVPLESIRCVGTRRPNCAHNETAIPSYPADRTNALVTCADGGKATCVRQCPNGCAIMPNGHDDECDPCAGKLDGTYCGRDLNLGPGNEDISIECKGRRVVQARENCP